MPELSTDKTCTIGQQILLFANKFLRWLPTVSSNAHVAYLLAQHFCSQPVSECVTRSATAIA